MIELRTFGDLRLRDSRGRDLCEKLQPKRLALLIYLAHPPRRFHRRDSLTALFWPELDPGGARNSLRQSLYELRRTLGKRALVGRGYEEITLDPDHVHCDVDEFQVATSSAREERALEIYRGDFLEGFHVQNVGSDFEHWIRGERLRLRNEALKAALKLVDREEKEGNLPEASGWARRAARLNPDDESVLRRLIGLLDRTGDRAGAVRAYETFADRARQEYDLEPAEETRRLVSEIRSTSELPESSAPSGVEVPVPPTTFIGRERELEALEDLMRRPGMRLVTLTGPGGCGKTRLALRFVERVEHRFTGGSIRVDLADVTTVEEALRHIMAALGLRDRHSRSSAEALALHLSDRDVLLFLDGIEHVRELGPVIVRLLRVAPELRIVAAGRRPFRASGEHEFPVPPLRLPQEGLVSTVEFPLNSEAVALFVERAKEGRHDFRLTSRNVDAVSEICCRLDGLPLAIELAAARVKTLTPEAIASRLEARFALLKDGPIDSPPRHRSLEAAMGCSYESLDAKAQKFFRRLGVFRGGFHLELVESLFETDGLSGVEVIDDLAILVDSSLVREMEIDGEPRFEMLETVREYARARLSESGEKEEWYDRHAHRMVSWVGAGERFYCGPEQETWLNRLELERGNIREALRWSMERGDISSAARLGAALWPYWHVRGHLKEGYSWLDDILDADGDLPPGIRARTLIGASWIASALARHEEAIGYARLAARAYGKTGDVTGRIRALETLGFVEMEANEIGEAERVFERCLRRSRSIGDDRRQAVVLDALGQIALVKGDELRAESLLEQSVALARTNGHGLVVGQGLVGLGNVATRLGAFDRAEVLYQEALLIYREFGQTINVAWTLSCLGNLFADANRMEEAHGSFEGSLTVFQEAGYGRGTARSLMGMARVALARRDPEMAARILGGVRGLLDRTGDEFAPDDASRFEALEERVRERLRDSEFTRLSLEGRKVDESSLIALATRKSPTARYGALN